MEKPIIQLTEEEWIEVIKLVEQKSMGHFAEEQNKYDEIKTKKIFKILRIFFYMKVTNF